MKKVILFIFVVLNVFCFIGRLTLAQTTTNPVGENTSAESPEGVSFEDLNDIPPGIVTLKVAGSLRDTFPGQTRYKSTENVILLDKARKEIGMHERVVDGDKVVDMYFKISTVDKKDLVDLFINKKIVASKVVKAALIIKEKSESGEKVLANKTEDENGNPLFATVFVKVDRLYSKDVNGKKFLYAVGEMKARLPEPPTLLKSQSARAQGFIVQSAVPAIMKSKFNCPTLNFSLTESLADIFGDDTIKQIFGGIN